MQVLKRYFSGAGEVTIENAWEHVYRCLLWKNEAAGLATFTIAITCRKAASFMDVPFSSPRNFAAGWGVSRTDLWSRIDYLFKGCVAELRRQAAKKAETGELAIFSTTLTMSLGTLN